MSDFDTGVEGAQAAAENTGVNGTQAAAVDDPNADFDESTLFTEDEYESEDISLEELLNEGSPETVVKAGDDNPTGNQTDNNAQAEQKEAAPLPQTVDASKAFAMRLQQERAKIEAQLRKEYEQKNAETLEDRIEGRAHKLMAEFPDDIKSLDYAKRVARDELARESTAQPETTQTAPTNDAAAKKEAWIQSLSDEEPLLRIATNDPNITWKSYAEKDSIFKTALSMGNSPMVAHEITKSVRAEMQREIAAAKAAGGQEVVNQIKQSNSRATASVSNVNTTGKHAKSAADMTPDEVVDAIYAADRQGKKLRFD